MELGIGLPDSSQKQVPFVFPLSLFGVLIYCNLGCLINKLFIIILLYEQVLMNLPLTKVLKNGDYGIFLTLRQTYIIICFSSQTPEMEARSV